MKKGYISVTVATLWTSPEFPRKADAHALQAEVCIPHWLSNLSREDRIALIQQNAVQTQVLFGNRVIIDKENEQWSHCYVPDQFTPKSEIGYPGWVPSCQIKFDSTYDQQYEEASSVWVTRPSAPLYVEDSSISLSYLTHLPYLEQKAEKVYVFLPTGKIGWLNHTDVSIVQPSNQNISSFPKKLGKQIVETGLAFLNVPYLWSGTSSFAYDCSGFSYSMHKGNGILIPRDASAQYQYGKELNIEISREELLPGDLIYFANENGKVDHVGIYAGNGQMLHASNSNFVVKLESLWESKYAQRYLGSMRFWKKKTTSQTTLK